MPTAVPIASATSPDARSLRHLGSIVCFQPFAAVIHQKDERNSGESALIELEDFAR
jgi:hypothetical protein